MSGKQPPKIIPFTVHERRRYVEMRDRVQREILELARLRDFDKIASMYEEYGRQMERNPNFLEL